METIDTGIGSEDSRLGPGPGGLKTNALLRGTNMAEYRRDASATEPPRIHLDPEKLLFLNGIEGIKAIETTVKIGVKSIRAARDSAQLTTRPQSVMISEKPRLRV